MGVLRVYPSKDTFITDYRLNGTTPQTGSNLGGSQVVRLFRVAPVSGSATDVSGSKARILVKFDLESIAALTSSNVANGSSMSYYLRLKDARHPDTLPTSYDVEVVQLSRDWDEGKGVDVEFYSDRGFSNWIKAKSNVYWTAQGGDTGSLRTSFHFDQGDEDLLTNVTPLVNSWLTGGVSNHGFMVHVSSTLETGSVDYYYKSFHSRHTHFSDFRPYLEARWDDSIKDDRKNFVFDVTGNLYLYNVVRGQYTNITGIGTGSNVLTVRIVDASGTIRTLSASHTGLTGIYSASFALPTGSYSGSLFRDIWFFGSKAYMTCSFVPTNEFSKCRTPGDEYIVKIINLKNSYENDEKVRLKMFVRGYDYAPAVVTTASADPDGLVITKGYYRVINDRTNEVVIPFGTGSPESTRLSYDAGGNYFDVYMSSLSPGNVYRLGFLFDVDGERKLVDDKFKFKVV
jgi:hypothetical protein